MDNYCEMLPWNITTEYATMEYYHGLLPLNVAIEYANMAEYGCGISPVHISTETLPRKISKRFQDFIIEYCYET